MPVSLRAFTDAASDAVAAEIAEFRREVAREREVQQAQFIARMAELDARSAALAMIERQMLDRIAAVQDGAPGRDGRDGIDGAPGRDGVDGVPGRDGIDGKDGVDGVPGANGRDGADGINGKDGRDGVDGKDGAPGERGPEGPAGKLPIVMAWTDRVHYEGEVVTRDGASYQALRDTGREPPHDDWIEIARGGRDGRDGADGRSFTIRGTYADGETYRGLDVVILNGASFVAKYDEPGACPGEGWQLMASQGKRGAPGERGPAGPKGERGPAGAPVLAMNIDDDGMLTLVNGDGSTVTCDFYPVLAKVGG